MKKKHVFLFVLKKLHYCKCTKVLRCQTQRIARHLGMPCLTKMYNG